MKRGLTFLVGPGRKEGSRGEMAVVTALAALCQHLPAPHSLTIFSALPQYFSLPLLLTNCEPALSWRHREVLSLNGKMWFSAILTHNTVSVLWRIKPFRLGFVHHSHFPNFSFTVLQCHHTAHERNSFFCPVSLSPLFNSWVWSSAEVQKPTAHCKQYFDRIWVEWDNFEMTCTSKLQ